MLDDDFPAESITHDLAKDWLYLHTQVGVLTRFILTHYPQTSSLTSGMEPSILPEAVYARFGRAVLEELWKRVAGSEPSVTSPIERKTPGA